MVWHFVIILCKARVKIKKQIFCKAGCKIDAWESYCTKQCTSSWLWKYDLRKFIFVVIDYLNLVEFYIVPHTCRASTAENKRSQNFPERECELWIPKTSTSQIPLFELHLAYTSRPIATMECTWTPPQYTVTHLPPKSIHVLTPPPDTSYPGNFIRSAKWHVWCVSG